MSLNADPQIKRSAELTFLRDATAADIAAFLQDIPAGAKVHITTTKGDPSDPREAGYRSTTITATWNGNDK